MINKFDGEIYYSPFCGVQPKRMWKVELCVALIFAIIGVVIALTC